jgi:hypothetical protein
MNKGIPVESIQTVSRANPDEAIPIFGDARNIVL